MYRASKEEQETIIHWDRGSSIAYIETTDPKTIRKLDKYVKLDPETYRCTYVDDFCLRKRYETDMKNIRFKKPVSEARRESARNSMQKINSRAKE